VKLLRTLSTRTLIVAAVAVLALAVGGAAIAVAARSSGPTPPPKPLADAIHDALAAPEPDGITARIEFTNNLFPSGSLLGGVGSALMSGASGRLWLTNDGRGRLELQSDAGDAQIVWNPSQVTVYDASSNTVYRFDLPAKSGESGGDTATTDSKTPPTVAEIQDFLSKLAEHATVSGADPTDVAGQAAYSVSLAPKHDGGLLGSAELAWDAAQGVPLRVAIYAQGSSPPVLELKATDISYGPVSSSDVEVAPPAGAKVVDLSGAARDHATSSQDQSVTGLDAVQAAVGFTVDAPDTLVGLPRKSVSLVGPADSRAALVVYGQGLGAIAVLERKAETGGSQQGGPLTSLPEVSLDGITAHELATQLGTLLEWRSGDVEHVLAGSLPPAAAEAAARALG
jgi:outer membrane lipoprotein-sorting protein